MTSPLLTHPNAVTTHDYERKNLMKIRFCAALLFAALSMTILAGCQANATLIPEVSMPRVAVASAASETSAPRQLTAEEAEAIALEHAGLTADQVKNLRTERDYERGKPEYEVDFRQDRWEYDYRIDAETGNIISYDKDLDD